MVFHLLAGLLSILTSSIVYIACAFIFAKDTNTIASLFLSLIVLVVLIHLLRAIFSPSRMNMRNSFFGMRAKGYSLRRIGYAFNRYKEREIISGSVARIFSFGTILFLATQNMFVVYAALVLSAGTGFILMLAHRHHFSDLISGAVLGLGIGFLSFRFAPLLIAAF